MPIVPEIRSQAEFIERLSEARQAVAGYAEQFPNEIMIRSIMIQLDFVRSSVDRSNQLSDTDKERLNFGTMASRVFSDLDERLEDELHELSYFIRHRL
jgi:hypothetical protein